MHNQIKTYLRICILAVIFSIPVSTSAAQHGFAIFIDSLSYQKTKSAVKLYAESVEKQGLPTETIIITENVAPDSIRVIVRKMATRKTCPIEGMVFIGDIPIPMIMDAQHMTSAFKIIQSTKQLERSACPSDRYYEDLDLKFDFIQKDGKKPLLYYYSLRYDSPQRTRPRLYSGRIKSMDFYGKDKYENIRDYLLKVVRIKDRRETLDQLLYFAGSGYNSESIVSRIDEKIGLLEQFPWLKRQSSAISFIDHKQYVFARYPLMSEMQRPDLSLAILHHHGAPNKEYINRYPDTRNVKEQLESAKFYFRSKIRSAVEKGVPLDSACSRYARDFDVPMDWFDNVFDPASIAADSIYDRQLDLHLEDFENYNPNARVVVLDACFNGAFNNDKYIAGAYIFGSGDCVAAIANSVNSLQDKLCDRNIGLLGLGMRIGNFVKFNPYLESHIIGDPTFAFKSSAKLPIDLNEELSSSGKQWRKLIDSPMPALQSMAMTKLFHGGDLDESKLLDIFASSPSFIVRLNALMLLSESGGDEFVSAIALGLDDSYELIRRFSASFAGKNGDPRLIPAIIRSYADKTKGERVSFQLQNAMRLFACDSLIAELERQQPFAHAYGTDSLMNTARKDISNRFSDKSFDNDLSSLDKASDAKAIRSFLRQLRNNPLHTHVDDLFKFLYKSDDEDLQWQLIETLGWFDKSYLSSEIKGRLRDISTDSRFSDKVRKEAIKSINRL